jgi:hypothetical protein
MRCEPRTLDDIRALGGNDAADERCFAAVDRVSQTNLSLYRTFVQPFVRAAISPFAADWMRQLHPVRLPYEIFSNANPAMASVATLAEQVRRHRQPAAADNPFLMLQDDASRSMVAALDAWRDASRGVRRADVLRRVRFSCAASCGRREPGRHATVTASRQKSVASRMIQKRIAELKGRIPLGGLREAIIRGLLFVGMARSAVDERGFEMVRRIRETESDVPLSAFKATVRKQFYMLLLDTEGALAAIPSMLPDDSRARLKAFDLIKQVLRARGPYSEQDRERLQQIARLFGADERPLDEDTAARRGGIRRAS